MLRASANSIRFLPLFGAPESTFHPHSSPLCSIIEIDGVTILLDCGATPDFSNLPILQEKLSPFLTSIDAVLLTSSALTSCGGLPLVYRILPAGVPFYATVPALRMGLINVVHAISSQYEEDHFPMQLTVEDIKSAFHAAREIPFGGRATVISRRIHAQQIQKLRGGGDGGGRGARDNAAADLVSAEDSLLENVEIDVKPLHAGKTVGACVWRIVYQLDDVLYAPSFSTSPSHHLKPMDITGHSTILITDASPCFTPKPRANTDALLFKAVRDALRRNGNVLLPCEPTGRGLELVVFLNERFEEEGMTQKLLLLHPNSKEILDRVRTMAEFLTDAALKHAEDGGTALGKVMAVRSAEEAFAEPGAKCILAADSSLGFGLAAALLPKFLEHQKSLVILTSLPTPGSPAEKLWELAQQRSESKSTKAQQKKDEAALAFSFPHIPHRIPLEGADLEDYLDELERREQRKNAPGGELSHLQGEGGDVIAVEDDVESDYDDSGEDEPPGGVGGNDQPPAAATAAAVTAVKFAEAMKNSEGGKPGAMVGDLISKNTPGLHLPRHLSYKSKFLMFPPLEVRLLSAGIGLDGENPYGIPLTENELRSFQLHAPKRIHDDSGPENSTGGGVGGGRGGLHDLVVPAKVEYRDIHCKQLKCGVQFFDLSGDTDGDSMRQLLRTYFRDARKMVFIRGSQNDVRVFQALVVGEELLAASGGEVFGARQDASLQLATAVFSFDIKLDPLLLQQVVPSLRKVMDKQGEGQWELGWIEGMLASESSGAPGEISLGDQYDEDDDEDDEERRPEDGGEDLSAQQPDKEHNEGMKGKQKRGREETEGESMLRMDPQQSSATAAFGQPPTSSRRRRRKELLGPARSTGVLPVLCPTAAAAAAAAAQTEGAGNRNIVDRSTEGNNLLFGSYFIGDVDLQQLKSSLQSGKQLQQHFEVEQYGRAPLLIVDKSIFVRRSQDGKNFGMEAVACHDQFTIRQSLYEKFAHVL